jgi:hypothetical protein
MLLDTGTVLDDVFVSEIRDLCWIGIEQLQLLQGIESQMDNDDHLELMLLLCLNVLCSKAKVRECLDILHESIIKGGDLV